MLRVLLVLIICALPGVAHAWNKKWVRTLIFHDKHAAAPWDGVAKYYYYWDDTGKRHRVDDDDRWLAGSTMGLKKLASDLPPTVRCRNPEYNMPATLCMPVELTPERKKELYERSAAPFYKDRNNQVYRWIVEPALAVALRPGLTGAQLKTMMKSMRQECIVAVHPWAVEFKWPHCGERDPVHWAWREGWDATNVPVTYDKTHLPRDQR